MVPKSIGKVLHADSPGVFVMPLSLLAALALLFYCLVSGAHACGEGGLGADSAGRGRPNDAPCP